MTVTVYLLHIEPPYKHAGHYIGIVRGEREVAHRWIEHMNKQGAVLTRYARRAGCQLILARIWKNAPFKFERQLKKRGGAARICPVCRRRKQQKQ